MIGEIFKALLITSLAGSALAAVITLLRPITKRLFGYSWHYYIWLCVLFVMLVPVRIGVSPAPAPDIEAPVRQITAGEQPEAAENIVRTDTAQKPQLLRKASAVWGGRTNISAYLWLIGAAGLVLLNIARYIRLNIKIRRNGRLVSCPEIGEYTDRKINVRVWGSSASPFMTGIFRPTLILPERELSEEQLHNILRNEMTHFKRHDILYKWFAELAKCVHWFNPVSWYASKQIAAECEISCDMAVTKNMTDSEEMSYVSTILSLLPTGKSKQLPLTTQMASGKKILKRRFIMIKNKKRTSRFMSVISAVIALVMLSATVFASGVLSDLTTDAYTVEILSGGEKIELVNKPFIENGEVYVPLREIIEKSVSKDDGVTGIKWNDGTIDVTVAYYQGESGMYRLKIGSSQMGLKHISFDERGKSFDEIENNAGVGLRLGLKQAPVLKNSTAYIPLKNASYMLYGFTSRRDENKVLRELTYDVYDKNGNSIEMTGNRATVVKTSRYAPRTPEYTVDQFFYLFGDGDFGNMKKYCTQKCIDTHFKIFENTVHSRVNNVYNMTTAEIIAAGEPEEYGENAQITYVTVKCVRPLYSSVFDPDGERSLGVITVRQQDGSYLIDDFVQ